MKLKLAEALLRRKELAGLVETRKALNTQKLFEPVGKRVKVTDSIDDLSLMVPKLTASQVMAEHDFYARQLRKVDALIQQANWTAEIDSGDDDLTADYDPAKATPPTMVPLKQGAAA